VVKRHASPSKPEGKDSTAHETRHKAGRQPAPASSGPPEAADDQAPGGETCPRPDPHGRHPTREQENHITPDRQ